MTQLDLDALQAAAEAAKDWDWYDKSYDEDRYYSDREIAACQYTAAANPAAVLALIDRLRKAESASKWISVKDGLPDSPHRKVIVWCRMFYAPSYIHVGTCSNGKWNFDDTRLGEITHWQPLPAAPDSVDSEGAPHD